MSKRTVTTQTELDAAIAAKIDWIEVNSPAGVWLEVRKSGSSTVTAYGSSTVTACGSSTVTACGSSTVTAYGSSTVTACDSSTVTACDSSTVTATPYAAVHLHSVHVHLTGGTVIDHTKVQLTDAKTWCAYHGVTVVKGVATVYKAVDDKWTTSRGTDYTPGSSPTAPDFNREDACGGGLHFGPTPSHALRYNPHATKFLAAQVALKDLVPITGDSAKCKAPGVVAPLVACDIDGRVVTS